MNVREMLQLALRFNTGLGDAWHLLSELKPSFSQVYFDEKKKAEEEAKKK